MSGLTVFFRNYLTQRSDDTVVVTATGTPLNTTTNDDDDDDDDHHHHHTSDGVEPPDNNDDTIVPPLSPLSLLPNTAATTATTTSGDNNTTHFHRNEQSPHYLESISTKRRRRATMTTIPPPPPPPGCYHTNTTTTIPSSSSATTTAAAAATTTFKGWRQQQSLYIQEYIAQRLFDPSSSSNNNNTTDNDDTTRTTTTNLPSLPPHHQQQHQPPTQNDDNDNDDHDDEQPPESQSQPPPLESQVVDTNFVTDNFQSQSSGAREMTHSFHNNNNNNNNDNNNNTTECSDGAVNATTSTATTTTTMNPPTNRRHHHGGDATATTTTSTNSSTTGIPNVVTDTFDTATRLDELDLHVHTAFAASSSSSSSSSSSGTVVATVLPITKVWTKRSTLARRKRQDRRRRPQPPRPQHATTTSFASLFQDDGPLAVLYERVVCMELYQTTRETRSSSTEVEAVGYHRRSSWHRQMVKQLTTVGQALDNAAVVGVGDRTNATTTATTNISNSTPPSGGGGGGNGDHRKFHTMKLFWYDSYADRMETIITDAYQYVQQQKTKATSHHRTIATTSSTTGTLHSNNSNHPNQTVSVELYLSLQNIPAKCIFPYYSVHQESSCSSSSSSLDRVAVEQLPDWYDAYHSIPYCICIGGDSAMMIQATSIDNNTSSEKTTTTTIENSQDGSSSQSTDTMDPTMVSSNNSILCPIAFDTDDQTNSEPIQIKCYMIPIGETVANNNNNYNGDEMKDDEVNHNTGISIANNNHDNNHDDTSILPQKIIEYTIRTDGTNQLHMEIFNCPEDRIHIRTIWKRIQTQRPHLIFHRNSHCNGNGTRHEATPSTFHQPNHLSNQPQVPPHYTTATATTDESNINNDNDDWLRRPPEETTDITRTLMSISELTSPGERLQRRRLINIATDDIQYQLSDIPSLPCKTPFSFYAAVISFNQPYRTKRGDWTMSLQLVDDSLQLCEDGLVDTAFVHSVTCNIFVKSNGYDSLPMVRYAGDVVRISTAHVQIWNNEVQLVSTKESTFVTLRGKGIKPDGTQRKPEMFPSDDENVVLSDMEWEHMLDMWRWAQRRMMLHATMKISHRFRLSDMHLPDSTHTETYGDENKRGDLTAMVAAIIPVTTDLSLSGVTPRGFLRVWDGTGIPKSDVLPIDSEQARVSVQDGDPPPDALTKIAKIIRKLKELRQNEDIQPPTKLSGRVANVAIWEKQHWELIEKGYVTIGSFIRLRNVQDTVFSNSNFRCLHVHAKSSLTPVPNLTFEVLHLLEEHNNRLLRMEPSNPDSGLLPLFFDDQNQNPKIGTQQPQLQPPQIGIGDLFRGDQELSSGSGTTMICPQAIALKRPTFYKSIKDFKAAPAPSVYFGLVDVVGIYPCVTDLMEHGVELICPKIGPNSERFYRFGLELDYGDSISVIVSDDRPGTKVGKGIFKATCEEGISNPSKIIERATWYNYERVDRRAQITSVEFNASKYFLLDYLE